MGGGLGKQIVQASSIRLGRKNKTPLQEVGLKFILLGKPKIIMVSVRSEWAEVEKVVHVPGSPWASFHNLFHCHPQSLCCFVCIPQTLQALLDAFSVAPHRFNLPYRMRAPCYRC
jgi:hypothetical protein